MYESDTEINEVGALYIRKPKPSSWWLSGYGLIDALFEMSKSEKAEAGVFWKARHRG